MIITEVTEDQCNVQTQSNYEFFCKQDAYRAYVFVFSNKDALELSEIHDYFSKFEDFIDVRIAGDEKGFRFIRFKTFEGAKKAMDKTMRQPSINLIPYKSSLKNKENVNCDSKNKEHTTNKFENKRHVHFKDDSTMSCDKRVKVETPEAKHHQKHRETTISDNENAVPHPARADKEVIPLLGTSAFEVIVANLHSSVSAAYILHLLDKYEPIAVSYVKAVPYKNLRYCHVYFKTAAHAMKAEGKLDRLDLNGNRLIVLRPTADLKYSRPNVNHRINYKQLK